MQQLVQAMKFIAVRRVPLAKVPPRRRGLFTAVNYVSLVASAVVLAGLAVVARALTPDIFLQWRLAAAAILFVLVIVSVAGESIIEDQSGMPVCMLTLLGYRLRDYRQARLIVRFCVCLPFLLPLGVVSPWAGAAAVGGAALIDFYAPRIGRWGIAFGKRMYARNPLFQGIPYIPGMMRIRLGHILINKLIIIAVVLSLYRFAGSLTDKVTEPVVQIAFVAVAALGFKSVFFFTAALNEDVRLWKVLGVRTFRYHMRAYSILCTLFIAASLGGYGAYALVFHDGMDRIRLAVLVAVIVAVSLFDYLCGCWYARYGLNKRALSNIFHTKIFAVGRGAVSLMITLCCLALNEMLRI